MNENISFKSLSQIKNRKNNEKIFIFLYSSILLAIGISSTSYGASFQNASENLLFVNVFYSTMFISSSIIMVAIWIFLFRNRFETAEAVEKGKNANYKLVLSHKGEKVNMYLRFGLIMFGLSSMAYIGMRTSIRFREHNYPASFIIYGLIQWCFIIIETCFILFNHRLIILSHQKIIKLCFVHLIITNILTWISGSIGKISSDFQKSKFCSKNKYDISCNLYVYFLPAVSEYAVIVTAILFELYTRIGKYKLIRFGLKKSIKSKFSLTPSAIISIVAGITIVIVCIFTSVSSVVLHVLEVDEIWLFHCHNSEIIILNIISVIILILAFKNSKQLKFSISLSNNILDMNILKVSYIFSLNFTLLSLFICGYATVQNNDFSTLSVLIIRIFSGLLEVIQNTFQTYLLVDAFQRCSFSSFQMESKPGRNYIAILMGINTGMWFLQSLQIKNADIIYYKDHHLKMYKFLQSIDDNVIGLLVRFLLQTTLPLSMLYRYHSSACLSEIYTKMYQTEAKRFELHLRAGNVHSKTEIMSEFIKKSTESLKHISYDSDIGLNVNNTSSCDKRSKSLGVIPRNVLQHVEKKMMRRATIKNMEIAHKQIISTELSLQLFKRNMKPKLTYEYNTKIKEKEMPNIYKMVKMGYFGSTRKKVTVSNDAESAYSI